MRHLLITSMHLQDASFGRLQDVLKRCFACLGKTSLKHLVDIFLPTGFYLHLVFYKQSVYKQLTLKWRIAEQLSGFNLLSLSNNRNYRNNRNNIKQQQKRQCTKIQYLKSIIGKLLKSVLINIDFRS